jgi:hypothetical protein
MEETPQGRRRLDLAQVPGCSVGERSVFVGRVQAAADHDDRQTGESTPDLANRREPVRTFEIDVRDDSVWLQLLDALDQVVSVPHDGDDVEVALQEPDERGRHLTMVIGQDD